jgi:Tfp pilus assembly protein PilF
LHIQRPALSETLANNEIANAARQLQAGDVSLAQRVFQALLTEDPHSVEAMEGMRLAFRQLGDAESEQKYLEMLRLEIPDYDFDRNEPLISGID